MHILGLIPARGGSKGIPRKNIIPLAGKPLLAYTCEAALASGYISRVVLSTDDEEIAQVGRNYGVEVPFMRPVELARDDTPSLPVAVHAIEWLQVYEGWSTDILVLLQPTSPLRRTKHIDDALTIMFEQQVDTVVSVVEVPHCYSPYKVMQLKNGRLQNFFEDPLLGNPLRRQSVPTLYARNGPAVLISHSKVLTKHHSFYGEYIVPYIMDTADSIDIDTPLDLQMAEWLLSQCI